MNIHFATDNELSSWNERILANPDGGNVLQSFEMAAQKALSGWTPRYIISDNLAFVALERSVIGLGKLWYVIKGPGAINIDQLSALVPELKAFAATNGVFLVKIEPEITKTESITSELARLGLLKARNIQPNAKTC